ncbi:polysaccharide deacetylase family protein [Sphingorhabdus sp. Alg239-R122]|uniref:polysaccharide deacetylase family protein n=1 Tax=Sphingorhabdus sp. Alg239-R122 TaxID=2305989 RepID=UPI0013D9EA7B|nr:polysaccharide deacetylase family protein [Sphingorhabdus sp. Alg239-R122]
MAFILNFHGIGNVQRDYEDGEEPYWIDELRFRECLDIVQSADQDVMLTFDDGNASDYLIAYPELIKRGLSAIFFVLAGKIGTGGYLTAEQVREIDNHDAMALGTHGMDHQPWPDLDNDELTREIEQSLSVLSNICGRPITAAGLPFGRYDGRVLKSLRQNGVHEVYSSDGAAKITGIAPFPRFSIRRDTDMRALGKMINSPPSLIARTKNELRAWIKAHR